LLRGVTRNAENHRRSKVKILEGNSDELWMNPVFFGRRIQDSEFDEYLGILLNLYDEIFIEETINMGFINSK
jgi:hypothetical protein